MSIAKEKKRQRRPRAVLTPDQPLALPARIFIEWREHTEVRQPLDKGLVRSDGVQPRGLQDITTARPTTLTTTTTTVVHRREGVLLHVDDELYVLKGRGLGLVAPVEQRRRNGECIICMFVVPGKGLMYFSSLMIAESVVRGTSHNITGWRGIRVSVDKPTPTVNNTASSRPSPGIRSSSKRGRIARTDEGTVEEHEDDTPTTTSSSSSSDEDEKAKIKTQATGKQSEGTVVHSHSTREKESDVQWLERRLERDKRKQREHDAKRQARLMTASRLAAPPATNAPGRRQRYFTLDAYYTSVGFVNAPWMHRYTAQIAEKISSSSSGDDMALRLPAHTNVGNGGAWSLQAPPAVTTRPPAVTTRPPAVMTSTSCLSPPLFG